MVKINTRFVDSLEPREKDFIVSDAAQPASISAPRAAIAPGRRHIGLTEPGLPKNGIGSGPGPEVEPRLAARTGAVAPPATEKASGKFDAANPATGPNAASHLHHGGVNAWMPPGHDQAAFIVIPRMGSSLPRRSARRSTSRGDDLSPVARRPRRATPRSIPPRLV